MPRVRRTFASTSTRAGSPTSSTSRAARRSEKRWVKRSANRWQAAGALRPRGDSQALEREGVVGAAVEAVERLDERGIGSREGEERHRRSEFQVVRPTEDVVRRAILDAENEPRVRDEAGPQDGVGHVGSPLVERSDRVATRHGARAEASELRENEPHPVRAFAPFAELTVYAIEDGCLGVHEALEIERIGGRHASGGSFGADQ